jgi:hypothetical protein
MARNKKTTTSKNIPINIALLGKCLSQFNEEEKIP